MKRHGMAWHATVSTHSKHFSQIGPFSQVRAKQMWHCIPKSLSFCCTSCFDAGSKGENASSIRIIWEETTVTRMFILTQDNTIGPGFLVQSPFLGRNQSYSCYSSYWWFQSDLPAHLWATFLEKNLSHEFRFAALSPRQFAIPILPGCGSFHFFAGKNILHQGITKESPIFCSLVSAVSLYNFSLDRALDVASASVNALKYASG